MKPAAHLFVALLICAGCKKDDATIKPGAPAALELLAVHSTVVPEPSGLAYFKKHNTLLTVSDANSTVYELGFDGSIQRSLKVASSDLEGIAVSVTGDTLFVASEASRSIDSYLWDGTRTGSLPTGIEGDANHGPEGVALDTRQQHLFVINEKNPRLLLEFAHGVEVARYEIDLSGDLSDIFYEAESDCLWIVSDESASVLKLSRTGSLKAEYSLPFNKGEGITILRDTLYIINDADGKLYAFKKPS
ncbi:MAG TPA: SdiA-regulated domain-containing protein [Bacteroidota bacterium]|nr:SdiA-regulated domain-containing protein [Bacteroidota bacterium]